MGKLLNLKQIWRKVRPIRTVTRLLDRHALALLLITIPITVILTLQIPKMRLATQMLDLFIPAGSKIAQAAHDVKKAFGDGSFQVVLSVEAPDGETVLNSRYLNLINDLTHALEKVPTIQPGSIHSLTEFKDLKESDDTLDTENLIHRFPKNSRERRALRSKLEDAPLVYGRLVSKDFRTSTIVSSAYFEASIYDIHAQVNQMIRPVLQNYPEAQVTVLGDAEVLYVVNTLLKKEMILFCSGALLMFFATLYLVFRSWKGVVFPTIPVVISILWTMGVVALYGKPITLLILIMPIALLVVGMSCAIIVYYEITRHLQKGKSYQFALLCAFKHLFSPLFLATVATVFGGASLITFKISPMQEFGIFTAIGTVFSFILCLFMIPAFLRIFRTPKVQTQVLSESERTNRWLDVLLVSPAQISTRFPWLVIGLMGALATAFLFEAVHIKMGFDNIETLPENHEIRLASYRLKKALNGTRVLDVMIDSGAANGVTDPAFLERIENFQKQVFESPNIADSYSILTHLKRVHHVLSPRGGELPQDANTVAQYLLLLSMSLGSNSISQSITPDLRTLKVSYFIRSGHTEDIENTYGHILRAAEHHFKSPIQVKTGGQPMLWIAIMRYLVMAKIQNMLSSLLSILLLIMVRYRSISRSFISVLPLILSGIGNFGLMSLLSIRLDFITATITSFAMGMAVDFTIHYLSSVRAKFKKKLDMRESILSVARGPAKAIFYNALCCATGFSILLLSDFPAVRNFAILMCFNMLFVAFCTFTIVPAVIMIAKPAFITGKRIRIKNNLRRKLVFASQLSAAAFVIVALTVGIFAAEADAGQPAMTASQLIKKSVRASHSAHEESIYSMKLIGKDGSEQSRKMRVWFKSSSDDDGKLLIRFEEPANIRGTGLLSIMEKGKEPSQWLYLPALRKSRRISGGNANESFLGSDFSVGDINVDQEQDFTYEIKGNTKCGDSDCYVLEGKPKSGASQTGYSKKVLHLRKDNFLNVYAEFFNVSNQLEKVLSATQLEKNTEGQLQPKLLEMKNVLTGHRTLIEYEKRDLAKNPADSLFTVRELEK